MQITKAVIPELFIITPDVFGDDRGFFMESFQEKRYEEILRKQAHFVQDNLSLSKKGVLRGLHYQAPPFDQGKLVTVLRGRVLDVAVDIRQGSPTFGQHVMVELSDQNHKQFWIPPGFAHGFLALEDDTLFAYKCTSVYSKEHDRGILWNDPALGINWGMENPLVSEKDKNLSLLKDIAQEFVFES